VWEADARSFQFTFVSPQAERLFGYPCEQWLEPDFWVEHLHPDDRAAAVELCVEATRARRNHTFEYRMLTADGVSGIAASNVAISLAVFTLLYGALAVVWFVLIRRGVTAGLPDDAAPAEAADDAAGTPLTFAY